MSKTDSNQISLDIGESSQNNDTARASVEEQPWDKDWKHVDQDDHEALPEIVLRKRKITYVAAKRGITRHEADTLLRYDDDVQVADSEVA